MNILLFYGGRSGEHEVSCVSAAFVFQNLKLAGFDVSPVYVSRENLWYLQDEPMPYGQNSLAQEVFWGKQNDQVCLSSLNHSLDSIPVDFVFPMIHGTTGEDGALQGMCEFLSLPYAGCGVNASAVCMDKWTMREIFKASGLPQVRYEKLEKATWESDSAKKTEAVLNKMKFPIFVKPCNMGSSVGVSKVEKREKLTEAIEEAFRYDDHILCEEGIVPLEIEISILGNFPSYEVSIPGTLQATHDFYSYEAKYKDDSGAEFQIPAKIPEDEIEKVQSLAKEAFAAVRGDGFARVDFFKDTASNEIYLNEINTLPGFTPISMYPRLWESTGKSPAQLLSEIVELGMSRFQKKQTLSLSH